MKSYVLIGDAVPEGESMFVLRKAGGKGTPDFEIWQPATGAYWHCSKPAERQGLCGRRANRAAGHGERGKRVQLLFSSQI